MHPEQKTMDKFRKDLKLHKIDNFHVHLMTKYVHERVKSASCTDLEDYFSYKDKRSALKAMKEYKNIIETTDKEPQDESNLKYAIWMKENGIRILIVSSIIENRMYELFDQWKINRGSEYQEKTNLDDVIGTLDRLDDLEHMITFLVHGGSRLSEVFGYPWSVSMRNVTKEYCFISENVNGCVYPNTIICPDIIEAANYVKARTKCINDGDTWKDMDITLIIKMLNNEDVKHIREGYEFEKKIHVSLD